MTNEIAKAVFAERDELLKVMRDYLDGPGNGWIDVTEFTEETMRLAEAIIVADWHPSEKEIDPKGFFA